jgi:hypothetical protein
MPTFPAGASAGMQDGSRDPIMKTLVTEWKMTRTLLLSQKERFGAAHDLTMDQATRDNLLERVNRMIGHLDQLIGEHES